MDDLLQWIISVAAATVKIGGLIGVYALSKKVYSSTGEVGGFLQNKVLGGQGAKEWAKKEADYRRNLKKADSLSGTRNFLGAGRYRRQERRDRRYEAGEAAAKSGAAQFGVRDSTTSQHIQSTAQSNAQVNAINAANTAKYVKGVASGTNPVSTGMGVAANDPDVEKAILSQQERAVAEAIREAELSAKIDPGAVTDMATKMAEAIKDGDSITARAMQNMLMNSGGAGTKAYRTAMEGLDPQHMSGDTMDSLKRNMLTNHSKVKDTAADLVKHAASSSGTTMQAVSNNPSTWKMSDEELVSQKDHSLEKAAAAGVIDSERARSIQKDEQLYRKLDDAGKKIIDAQARKVDQGDLSIAHSQALNEEARRNSSGGGGGGTP